MINLHQRLLLLSAHLETCTDLGAMASLLSTSQLDRYMPKRTKLYPLLQVTRILKHLSWNLDQSIPERLFLTNGLLPPPCLISLLVDHDLPAVYHVLHRNWPRHLDKKPIPMKKTHFLCRSRLRMIPFFLLLNGKRHRDRT